MERQLKTAEGVFVSDDIIGGNLIITIRNEAKGEVTELKNPTNFQLRSEIQFMNFLNAPSMHEYRLMKSGKVKAAGVYYRLSGNKVQESGVVSQITPLTGQTRPFDVKG